MRVERKLIRTNINRRSEGGGVGEIVVMSKRRERVGERSGKTEEKKS